MGQNPSSKKEADSTNVLEALHKPLLAIGTYNEEGELLMTRRQAKFYAFQTIACGINWELLEPFVQKANMQILAGLEKFSKMEEKKMMSKKQVDEHISELKRTSDHHLLSQSSDYLLENHGYADRITPKVFSKIYESLQLPHLVFSHDYYIVWESRALFIWGTIRVFYPFYMEEAAIDLLDELAFKCPCEKRADYIKKVKTFLKHSFSVDREEYKEVLKETPNLVFPYQELLGFGPTPEGLSEFAPSKLESDQKREEQNTSSIEIAVHAVPGKVDENLEQPKSFKNAPMNASSFKKDVNTMNVLEALHKPLVAIGTYNEQGELMMTGRQAMFYAFQTLVCGINWQSEEPFVVEASEQIADGLEKFSKMEEGKEVSKKYVEEYIAELKRASRHHLLRQSSDYLLQNYGYDDRITTEDFYKIHEDLNFPQVDVNADYIRVWQARTMFIWATIRTFFSFDEEEVAMKLLDELAFKAPPTKREGQLKILKNMLKGLFKCDREAFIMDTNIPVHSDPSLESTLHSATKNHGHEEVASSESLSQSTSNCKAKESKTQELKSNEKDSKLIPQSTSTKSQVKVEVVKTEKVPEPSKCEHQLKPPQKKIVESLKKSSILKSEQAQSKPESTSNKTSKSKNPKASTSESKLCEKCTRNVQERNKAKTKMEEAVKKADLYEEKALKSIEIENKMKKMKKEMEELNKKNQLLSEKVGELQTENSNITEEKNKLMDEVVLLGSQLASEQQTDLNSQEEKARLNQKIEGIQLSFTLKLSQLEEKIIEKDAMIQNLRRRHAQKPYVTSRRPEPPMPPERAPSPEPSCSSDESGKSSRWHLMKWQRYKDNLERDSMLKQQKERLEKLIRETNDRKMKGQAEYELIRLKGTMYIYLRTVDINVQKIRKTDDFSNLLPLPDYPELSSEFLGMFDQEDLASDATSSGTSSRTSSNNPTTSGTPSEPSTSSKTSPVPDTGFDPKLDCYICLDKFQEGQKVAICKGCSNPVHEKCGEGWSKAQKELNVKDEACGFCRRRMEIQNQKNKKK